MDAFGNLQQVIGRIRNRPLAPGIAAAALTALLGSCIVGSAHAFEHTESHEHCALCLAAEQAADASTKHAVVTVQPLVSALPDTSNRPLAARPAFVCRGRGPPFHLF